LCAGVHTISMACPDCGSSDLVEEEGMAICSSCGSVLDANALLYPHEFNPASTNYRRPQQLRSGPNVAREEARKEQRAQREAAREEERAHKEAARNKAREEERAHKEAARNKAREEERAQKEAAKAEEVAQKRARERDAELEAEAALAVRWRELAAWQQQKARAKASQAPSQASVQAAAARAAEAAAQEREAAKRAAREEAELWQSRLKEQQQAQLKEAGLRQQALLREARLRQAARQVATGAPSAYGSFDDAYKSVDDLSTDELVRHVLAQAECPWKCLFLAPHAPPDEVRKRYKQLVLRLHPDKTDQVQAAQAFAAVESAYQRQRMIRQ